MRIYVDPTELASTSRLSKDVAGVAIPLPHLEERTGADLLLSTLSIPCNAENDALLHKHCDAGLLAQLKRHDDLQASITDQRLFYEIFKMRQWTSRPWLVVTGAVLSSEGGKAVIADVEQSIQNPNRATYFEVYGREGLDFSAVDAALDAFTYYGGYVKFLQAEDFLMPWLQRQEKALLDIQSGKVKELMPRQAQRDIVGPTKVSWLASLFSGVGQKTAKAIFTKLEEIFGQEAELYQAIAYLTNYASNEISGVTLADVEMWRDFIGLPKELDGNPPLYATLGLEWRLKDTGEVYWRGQCQSDKHYRNDGPIDRVYTVETLRSLLGYDYQVTYKMGDKIVDVYGTFDSIVVDGQFEWLNIDGIKVRLDLIENIELMLEE